MVLNWQPPTNNGGTPVLGYHIEKRSSTSKHWVFLTKSLVPDTNYKVTDLVSDMEYEFRVSAENKVGTGPPSEPSLPTYARDPWGMSIFLLILCCLKKVFPARLLI